MADSLEGLIPNRRPHFTLEQDAAHVYVSITCSHEDLANGQEVAPANVVSEGSAFGFTWADYYLPYVLSRKRDPLE